MRMLSLCLLLLLAPTLTHAETIDLPGAIRAAVAERPQLQAARGQNAAATAAVGAARSRYLPRLTLSETFNWTNEPGGSLFIALNQEDLVLSPTADPYNHPPDRKDFETRLTLEQPLFDPDIYYSHRLAKAEAAATRSELRWGADEAAFAAFRAYLDVQRADAAQAWTESSRAAADEIVRVTTERHQAGLSLKADLLRARVYRSETERRALSARNDQIVARQRLALAIGRERGEVGISAPLTVEAVPLPGDEIRERGDLAALAAREEAATFNLKRSRGDWLPRAGIGAFYALHDETVPLGSEAEAWGVRAGLTWELFDGFRRSYGTERAAAQQLAARALREEAVRQNRLAIAEARLRVEEAAALEASARQAAAEAEESFRLIQQRHAAGLADLSTLLETGSALDRARYDAVAAEAGLILARGNLRLQSGLFLHDYLSEKEITP